MEKGTKVGIVQPLTLITGWLSASRQCGGSGIERPRKYMEISGLKCCRMKEGVDHVAWGAKCKGIDADSR